MIRVRLTKKLAAILNGVDVSGLQIGDVIELPDSAARMMIAEGWAAPATEPVVTHLLSQPTTGNSSLTN